MKGAFMTRNLLRLAALAFVLAATFGLTLPRPALAISCGTGDHFVSCTKTCCGNGVTTIYNRQGVGRDCTGAKAACSSCLPACPSGQSLCGSSFGNCVF
jgi:hypothetical protein